MPDVEKRIVIAVESGEALQKLGKVKGSTDQLIRAKKEELKISRAKLAFDKAEAASATAAQKAYNAELAKERKEKELLAAKKRGADAAEIRKLTAEVKRLTEQYQKLAEAETLANNRAKLAKDNLTTANASAADFADSRASRGFFGRGVVGQLIGRRLGIPIGRGMSGGMATVAAAGAAISAVNYALDQYADHVRSTREAERQFAASAVESAEMAADALNGYMQKRMTAFAELNNIGANEVQLGAVSKLEQSQKLAEMTAMYGDLGIEIDSVTGKVKNYAEIKRRQEKRANEIALQGLRSVIRAKKEEIATYEKAAKAGTGSTILNAVSKGAVGHSDAEIAAATQAQARLNTEIVEAERQAKEYEARIKAAKGFDDTDREKAVLADLQESYDKEIATTAKQYKIQELIIAGKEREAELLKINNRLDEERLKLGDDEKKLAIFDAQREARVGAAMSLFDLRENSAISQALSRVWSQTAQMFSTRYRQTSQNAVRADSIEGFRLLSRRFITPTGVDKQLKETQKQTKLLEQIAANTKSTNMNWVDIPVEAAAY